MYVGAARASAEDGGCKCLLSKGSMFRGVEL